MAETMLASRDLLVNEMRKLDNLAEIAKTGSDEQAMAFRYQLELVANLQKNIKGAQTEIARSQGAMRIEAVGVGSTPELSAEFAARSERDLSTLLGEYGGAEDVRRMADLYSRTGAPHKKGAFVKGVSKARVVGDAIYEVWQHALLTNPGSGIPIIASRPQRSTLGLRVFDRPGIWALSSSMYPLASRMIGSLTRFI